MEDTKELGKPFGIVTPRRINVPGPRRLFTRAIDGITAARNYVAETVEHNRRVNAGKEDISTFKRSGSFPKELFDEDYPEPKKK